MVSLGREYLTAIDASLAPTISALYSATRRDAALSLSSDEFWGTT
jgi:hypothetical protein